MTPKQCVFIKGYKYDELGETNFMEITGLDEVSYDRPIFNLFSKPKGKCNN